MRVRKKRRSVKVFSTDRYPNRIPDKDAIIRPDNDYFAVVRIPTKSLFELNKEYEKITK